MVRPSGQFVGYRKFAVDKGWIETQKLKRRVKREEQQQKWHSNWITVSRLKQDRLWTDGAMKKWLGEPQKQGKYKVFAISDVVRAERKKAFKEWLAPRLEKKQSTDPHFVIKKVGAI